MHGRDGFSLIEMLMVVVLIGIVSLLGFPKLRDGQIRSDVRSARTTVVSLLARARVAATQTNRKAWVRFQGNQARVLASPRRTIGGSGTLDTVGPVVDFSAAYGVTLTSTADSILFDPRGLGSGFGTGATIRLSRSWRTDSVRVDGLGRVRK